MLWVESVVVGSRPWAEGFSPGSQVSLPPLKPTFLNANSTWNARSLLKRAPLELFGQCSVDKQITFTFFKWYQSCLIVVSVLPDTRG